MSLKYIINIKTKILSSSFLFFIGNIGILWSQHLSQLLSQNVKFVNKSEMQKKWASINILKYYSHWKSIVRDIIQAAISEDQKWIRRASRGRENVTSKRFLSEKTSPCGADKAVKGHTWFPLGRVPNNARLLLLFPKRLYASAPDEPALALI